MNDHDLNQIYRPRSFSEVVGNARTKQKLINFINASDNVAEMFRTVAANRALPKSKIEAAEIETIDVSYLSKLAAS